jgi:hypothetical protein
MRNILNPLKNPLEEPWRKPPRKVPIQVVEAAEAASSLRSIPDSGVLMDICNPRSLRSYRCPKIRVCVMTIHIKSYLTA